jgi:hypothetical protein
MNSIEVIENEILEHSTAQDRQVKGIWGVDCLFYPINNGRIFDYKFLISQTRGQGCAYSTKFDYSREFLRQYIGHDFLECAINDIALKVSFLDSLYGIFSPPKNSRRIISEASSIEKMKWRTQIILDEATRLLGDVKNKKVVNVGVVGDILHTFAENGAEIKGTDYDTSIAGTTMFGHIPVFDGKCTIKEISDSDLAIITGMAITSNTIDEIIECCINNNVKTIVFAETGANLAGYYLKHGIDVYLSEYFPFYIFNGNSVIDVCYG